MAAPAPDPKTPETTEETDSAPFAGFAATLSAIAEEPGRNAKADLLGAYLRGLGDADLARAARWAAGRVFPLADQRTVDVGHAALLKAVAAAAGAEPDALRARLVELGDPGDVAAEALAGSETAGPFTLADAAGFFAAIAATRGSTARTEAIGALLARLSPVEARFVAKLLAGETRIGLLQGGVEAALARTFGRDAAAVRRAHMLTGDLGRTARLARDGRLGEARFTLFHPITFMLATPAEAAPGEDPAPEVAKRMPGAFAVEDKYDGIRAQAHVAPDPAAGDAPDEDGVALHGVVHETARGPVRVALFSRTLDENTRQFPELVAPLAALAAAAPGGLVLDGEIVPVAAEEAAPEPGGPGDEAELAADAERPADAEPRPRIVPFASLQKRLGRKAPPDGVLAAHPVAFVAYDVLLADGALRLDAPFAERRADLDALALAPPLHRSPVAVLGDPAALDAAFDAARARGNEGLMVKALDAPYTPGRRGREWLKIKRALATLDVVVTSAERGSGGRRRFYSDLTFSVRRAEDDPALVTIGKAYSGLTDAELAELTAWIKAHTVEQFAHGRVRIVEPEVVLEVTFDAVRESARHKSGYALRFPRIVRRRPDKPASEVDTLETVRAIYDSQHHQPSAP